MSNRLAEETSPYLLQHKDNPVDWQPWGPEALQAARDEDKPIFLSVGYSTCYWCHVMERESFENPATAALMNEAFVNIKVDREERPDLDEIYMVATQVMSGQGGWPNSLFLTPDLEPYFAGTYFPPDDMHGRPGFPSVLRSMRDAWHERRDDVHAQAASVAGAIRRYLEERSTPVETVPGTDAAERAMADLQRRYDPRWGGFGGAPKFPTPSNLMLLTELADGDRPAAEMLANTLDQMARGGIYDQLGGGFHRYATDREWKIPHFEKMLYDNAWLLEVYARHHRRTGDAQAARVVRETAEFLDRELTGPEGAFWSALDAETEGHEGAFYVWTRDELEELLGAEDAAFLAPIYGFDRAPLFEGTHHVLHLPVPLEDQAKRRNVSVDGLLEEVAPLAAKLLDARSRRPPLATDDKILADWNGMAIAGLAVAGRLLVEPIFVDRAARAAHFILATLRDGDGTLLHAWRDGKGKVAALLGDYVAMSRGLLALHAATGDGDWLRAAIELTEEQIDRLHDAREGGFFVAAEAADVLVRSKEIMDGAVPGTNGLAIDNLLTLAQRTDDPRWGGLAEQALKTFGSMVESHPSAVVTLTLAARRFAAVGGGRGDGGAASASEKRFAPPVLWADLEGGSGSFRLELTVSGGWHIYALGDAPPATTLELAGGELVEVTPPEPETWQGAPELPSTEVYRGKVEISGRVEKVRDGAVLRLTYQLCDDQRCLAPETVEVRL